MTFEDFFVKEGNWCSIIIKYAISSYNYNSWHFFKDLCSCISISSYCPEQTWMIYGNVYWFDVKRFKNRYRILVECSFLPGFCDFSDHLPTVTLVAMVWFLKIDHVKLLKACMLLPFLYGDVFSIIIHVTLMQYMWSKNGSWNQYVNTCTVWNWRPYNVWRIEIGAIAIKSIHECVQKNLVQLIVEELSTICT